MEIQGILSDDSIYPYLNDFSIHSIAMQKITFDVSHHALASSFRVCFHSEPKASVFTHF